MRMKTKDEEDDDEDEYRSSSRPRSLPPRSLSSLPCAAGGQKLDPHQPYALVFGTIYGPDDRPVQGVKIKMRRDGEKKTIELLSDSHGEFAHRFPAGKADYLVWADLKGQASC